MHDELVTPTNFTAMTAVLTAKVGQAGITQAGRNPSADFIDKLDKEINLRLTNVRTDLDQQYEDEDGSIVRGCLAALSFKLRHGNRR